MEDELTKPKPIIEASSADIDQFERREKLKERTISINTLMR